MNSTRSTIARVFSAPGVPVVQQSEAADCGLACLVMVAQHFGGDITLPDLRQRSGISSRGINLLQLSKIAVDIGLTARPVKVGSVERLTTVKTPCILHWEFNHFVVLVSAGPAGLVINDPATGRRQVSLADAERCFTGVALLLSPSSDFETGILPPPVKVRDTIGRLPGFKQALMRVLAIAAIVELCVVALPFQLQWVLDQGVPNRDGDLLLVLGAGFVTLSLFHALFFLMRNWAISTLGAELNFQWMANAFFHLLRLPIDFFERRALGSISSRFDSIAIIQRAVTSGLAEGIVDGLFVMGTLAMMLLFGPRLALISIVAVLLYCGTRLLLDERLRMLNHEMVTHTARQRSTFFETVRGIQTLRLYRREADRGLLWTNHLADQFRADLHLQRANGLIKAAQTALFGLERTGVVWIAGLALIDGRMSVGVLVAYLAYREQFMARCFSLADRAHEWRLLGVHAQKLSEIVHVPPEETDGHWPDISRIAADIEVKNLSFRYGKTEHPVLRSVSLHIAEGECVAITGPSGCGKTTLAKLVLGLLAADDGEIWIGGVSTARMSLAQRRSLFGTVMQEDGFFTGSIAENICFFDAEPDHARIEECARVCGVYDEVAAMPMGFNTFIGQHATAMSGGQKQRLLLARALYQQPRILILDEATSHLDVKNEKTIGEAIAHLKMTRIVIAHRPDTIAMCDRLISLDVELPAKA